MGKTWKDRKDLYNSVCKPNAPFTRPHENKRKKKMEKLADNEKKQRPYEED